MLDNDYCMKFDLNRIFEDRYPGLVASAKLGSVKDYLETVAEYLPLIQEQNTVRFRARLRAEYPGVEDNDLSGEWESHNFTTQVQIPCLIGGSVIISLWAAFEYAAHELCEYVRSKESSLLKFSDLRESDLRRKTIKYVKVVAKKDVDISQSVSDIQLLRNLYAHHNGVLANFSNHRIRKVMDVVSRNKDVYLYNNEIVVLGIDYIRGCYFVIDKSLQKLLNLIHSKYPWPDQ